MSSTHQNTHEPETHDDVDRAQKVQSLREMIAQAERTMQSAKAMLLQLEGKKKLGRPKKIESGDGTIIEGTFDGQIMLGTDGKQYPVPANYASKSKLIEGDMLKLTITGDGSFVYKQIGPIERRHMLGIVTQDDKGNYYVVAEGTAYRILLASITYFKAEPGDEVAIVVPRDLTSSWAALESVIQKRRHENSDTPLPRVTGDQVYGSWKNGLKEKTEDIDSELPSSREPKKPAASPLDDWVQDMKEIESQVQKDDTQTEQPNDTPLTKTSSSVDSSFLDQWLKDMEEVEKQTQQEETSPKETVKSE